MRLKKVQLWQKKTNTNDTIKKKSNKIFKNMTH